MASSALEIAAAVKAGTTSASEQIEAAMARAAAVVDLNIFTYHDADAPRRAAALDAAIDRGEDPGALAGVPFVVKDLIDQAGLPNTCGASFAPFIPATTAPCVAALEAAGAVAIGRVGLHEFAFGFSSENPWFGPVHNPLDPRLATGGSSGGSAAAIAAGVVPVALGTDTGGSVRVPAALCGIVGLKVTHGRGSLRGVYPLAPSLDTVGPLAASVSDAEAAYLAIGRHDPADRLSVDRPIDPPAEPAPLESLRLAVPHPWVDTGYEPRIEDAFGVAVDRLAELGAVVDHVTIEAADPPGMGLASAYFEAAAVHRARYVADPAAYGEDLQRRLRDALAVTAEQYDAALQWRRALRTALDACLARYDAVLTPTTAAVTKLIGGDEIELTTGRRHYRAPLSHFTALVNNAGLPALTLPIAGTGTPPLSLQLIGPAWRERRLLGIGKGLENSGLAPPAIDRKSPGT